MMGLMRPHLGRRLTLTTMLVLALATSGCSGDDEKDATGPEPSPTGSGSGAVPPVELPPGEVTSVRACASTVTTAGQIETEWTGDADVRVRGGDLDATKRPRAVYTTGDRGVKLAVYSKGPDFEPAATISSGDFGLRRHID